MANEKALNERIRELRNQYARERLSKADLNADPIEQLRDWLNAAIEAEVMEPNAMTLATADKEGRPSTRIVLIRELSDGGPVFFTNYESRKGKELQENPYASGNLFWPELQRQVRVEGMVERISAEGSDAYFNSRPLKSRIGAWASEQSRSSSSREELERKVKEWEARFEGKAPERPEHWGGYRILADRVEFWQGRPDRLHDRIVMLKEGGSWKKERLDP